MDSKEFLEGISKTKFCHIEVTEKWNPTCNRLLFCWFVAKRHDGLVVEVGDSSWMHVWYKLPWQYVDETVVRDSVIHHKEMDYGLVEVK